MGTQIGESPSPRPDVLSGVERPDDGPAAPVLLVVDPDWCPTVGAALRRSGVTLTVVSGTLDGLVVFGRMSPTAVLIGRRAAAGSSVGLGAFTSVVLEHGAVLVMHVGQVEHPAGTRGALVALPLDFTASDVAGALRWSRWAAGRSTVQVLGPLRLDVHARSLDVGDEQVDDLPPKEVALLNLLMARAPDVVTNAELKAVWDEDEPAPADNTLAVHLARLRHRLGAAARIRSIRGRGYVITL